MSILPYTPGNMSYEELKACFVGRQPLLDELLDTLREQAGASTLQHWMILGSRGMGKTHLIRLFHKEIIEDPDLTKLWLPILMHEEEQVVFNLPTLFARIIEMLAESLENRGYRDAALSTIAFLDTLRDKAKGQTQLLNRAIAYLKQFSMDQGWRLVVLLENADDLLTKCLPKESDVQRLRKILSLDNFILIIGASPTFFPRISEPKGIFYDFFRLRRLELLTFQQALELLQKWAEQETDEARLVAFSKADYRLKVMYHLTGGNPRLLYFLYKAISNVDSLEDASSTFETMLEKDLTAYYLSRMRDIPNQVQAVVITLAKSEKNLTQKEIAHQSFLPVRSLGTQIQRLEKEDVVKPVSGKKGKNTIYTLTDYLFRVWYQWRYAKQKKLIRGLVEFLAVWFSRRELEQMCGVDGMAGQYYTEALEFKHGDSFKPHLEAILQEGAVSLREFAFKGEYIDAASILADIGEYAPDRREAFKKLIRESGLSDEPKNIEKVMQARIEVNSGNSEDWFWLGYARLNQNNYAGAEVALQKAVDLKKDDPDAWKLLGLARGVQEDYADAEVALQKAVDLEPDNTVYRNLYACILFRSNRFKEAIKAQYQILKMDRFYTEAYFDLCIFNLLTGSVDTLSATMEKALRTKKAPSGFKTQIQLFFALVLAHDGEKKAFLKNLGSGIRTLETIEEELRRKILSDLSRFLVDAISPMTLESVKTYLDEFQKATEDTAVLSIIRPLTHVLEYTQACITQKAGYASKQAQKALDRVPGELKGPVEEMANEVRKNLRWQSKPKKKG